MKNALVVEDHYGDNGALTAGMIIRNITATRFNALEKRGLVREATKEEVEKGDQHVFEKDTSADQAEKAKAAPANKQAPTPANKAG